MIGDPSSLAGATHCSPIEVPVLDPATSVIDPGAVGKPAALTVIS